MSINGHLRPSLARRSALLTIDMQRDFALPSSRAHIAGTRTSAHIVAMFPRLILCFGQSRHASPPHMGTCPKQDAHHAATGCHAKQQAPDDNPAGFGTRFPLAVIVRMLRCAPWYSVSAIFLPSGD